MYELIRVDDVETYISCPSQHHVFFIIADHERKEAYVIPLYFRWRHGYFSIETLDYGWKDVVTRKVEGLKEYKLKLIQPNKYFSTPSADDVLADYQLNKPLIEIFEKVLVGLVRRANAEEELSEEKVWRVVEEGFELIASTALNFITLVDKL